MNLLGLYIIIIKAIENRSFTLSSKKTFYMTGVAMPDERSEGEGYARKLPPKSDAGCRGRQMARQCPCRVAISNHQVIRKSARRGIKQSCSLEPHPVDSWPLHGHQYGMSIIAA